MNRPTSTASAIRPSAIFFEPWKFRGRHAFTLVELLVVIGVIGLLAAIGLPALSAVKERTYRVTCAHNLQQWGLAVTMYAGDNNEAFPENTNGMDTAWVSPSMTNFWNFYLHPNKRGVKEFARPRSDLFYCPTDLYHRLYEANMVTNDTQKQLLGYLYLPGRSRSDSNVVQVARNGTAEWFYRSKMGGQFSKAPILMDRIQALGPDHSTNVSAPKLTWTVTQFRKTVPIAVHRDSRNVPFGGNFLFEDGHVAWTAVDKVTLGAFTGHHWLNFFKIPID